MVRFLIMAQDSYQKLYARGMKILTLRSSSENELADKLSRYGCAEEVAKLLAEFKALHLINDLDFAVNYASYRVTGKHLGRLRAAQELKKRKVPEPVIRRALDEVYALVDEDTLIDQAIEKWRRRSGEPGNAQSLKRLMGFLQRQGFPSERLYAKLSRYFSVLEESANVAGESERRRGGPRRRLG